VDSRRLVPRLSSVATRLSRRGALRVLGFVLAWLVVALPSWAMLFTHSSTEMVLASHDATVHPTFDGRVRLDMGPYLPDLRTPSGGRIGVSVEMHKTTVRTTTELAQRYAAIAARPGAEVTRVKQAVVGLARDAALRAAGLGLLPIGLWLLVGERRRRELALRMGRPGSRGELRAGATVLALTGIAVLLVAQPWRDEPERVQDTQWLPVQQAVPEVTVPADLDAWEIQGGLVTQGTQRLLSSLFDTYARSKVFYRSVADRVDVVAARLHQPSDSETVAVLVSDRHDNIGMDEVVRKVADAAGATVVLDAGDDTSTGETWEGFSLDSLDEAFESYDARVAVSGNHDNGTFVNRHLQALGWTHLTGKAVKPFGGVRITGVDDPRSSGLGNWRDEKGLSFEEVKAMIADDVCRLDAEGNRIATLLVHDAKLGETALARGCADLVLAGHLHVQVGPDRVVGENGKAGYTYTNGTTGGAAYAIAMGSKLRRDAEFTLVTYRGGRPVGIQPVTVRTTGDLSIAPYTKLDLG
jgi:predicted phosphodiesterase